MNRNLFHSTMKTIITTITTYTTTKKWDYILVLFLYPRMLLMLLKPETLPVTN